MGLEEARRWKWEREEVMLVLEEGEGEAKELAACVSLSWTNLVISSPSVTAMDSRA